MFRNKPHININNLREADDATHMAESEEGLKSLLMKVKEEREKVGLILNIQKTMIMASGPITSWEIDLSNFLPISLLMTQYNPIAFGSVFINIFLPLLNSKAKKIGLNGIQWKKHLAYSGSPAC